LERGGRGEYERGVVFFFFFFSPHASIHRFLLFLGFAFIG
jgi:hypothetical protein